MTAPLCRFCRSALTRTFLDLGLQPLANSYLTPEQLAAGDEPVFPLHTRVCDRCFLVQADHEVPAEAIFDAGYAYFSSFSPGWVAHAKRYADAMIERFGLGPESLVVEVASNDGYLLKHFLARDVPVLGIEPTANTAEAARAIGVRTDVVFFNAETGQALAARGDRADLMAANNVLAHVPDLNAFVAGFQHVLKPEGVLTFEFPHLLNLIEKVQFDTIYHEHYSYLSLLAVEQVLAAHGLRVFDVELLPTHGGSLRLFCCHRASGHEETGELWALRRIEAAARLDRHETYDGFTARAEAVRMSFNSFLAKAREDGKTIAAYGAAAKGNTFLNYCGATANDIVEAYDANPAKQGRYLPGSHIPVFAPSAVSGTRPDYVLILPWNLKDEITSQLAFIADWGAQFVIASPETRVVPHLGEQIATAAGEALQALEAAEVALRPENFQPGMGHNRPPEGAPLKQSDYEAVRLTLLELKQARDPVDTNEEWLKGAHGVLRDAASRISSWLAERTKLIREGFYRQIGASAALALGSIALWYLASAKLAEVAALLAKVFS